MARGVGTAAAETRALAGEKANRIVEAMRESVAEVGIAGSTFERVAARADVSRGLLHYYFGSKERLLVEVIRRDTEYRIQALEAELRSAASADDVIAAFFTAHRRRVAENQGEIYMGSELFVAGRHNEEILRELGALYSRAREAVAEIIREKEREGVLRLRFDAESTLAYLTAAADGGAVQMLADPSLDSDGTAVVGHAVARFLFAAGEPAGPAEA